MRLDHLLSKETWSRRAASEFLRSARTCNTLFNFEGTPPLLLTGFFHLLRKVDWSLQSGISMSLSAQSRGECFGGCTLKTEHRTMMQLWEGNSKETLKDQLETTIEKMGNYNFVGRQMSLHNSTIREPMKNWTELKLVDDLKSRNVYWETKVKLKRAQGECLGIRSRWRSW